SERHLAAAGLQYPFATPCSMTTSSVLHRPRETFTPVLIGPRYSLTFSTDPDDREAAQRLRHNVFAHEPGFGVPASADGLDADHFDDHCDHILVRDRSTGDVVGCCRMLTPHAARDAGGYYTATEFDLGTVDPYRRRIVEMGRACVDPAHRSGAVLTLMWAGILHYLDKTGHGEVMGCVSVPMRGDDGTSAVANVRSVRDLLLERHAAPPELRVLPRNPVVVGGRPLDRLGAAPKPHLPPLLRGYLRLGARI